MSRPYDKILSNPKINKKGMNNLGNISSDSENQNSKELSSKSNGSGDLISYDDSFAELSDYDFLNEDTDFYNSNSPVNQVIACNPSTSNIPINNYVDESSEINNGKLINDYNKLLITLGDHDYLIDKNDSIIIRKLKLKIYGLINTVKINNNDQSILFDKSTIICPMYEIENALLSNTFTHSSFISAGVKVIKEIKTFFGENPENLRLHPDYYISRTFGNFFVIMIPY